MALRTLALGLILLTALPAGSQSLTSQFLPFPAVPGHIIEGHWQSCMERDGKYAERIYDHIVNEVPEFEVHMGPRREFAIFKGVQDEHRDHTSADNLLKPFNVPMAQNRARQQWEIPSLGLVFSVTLGGGSRTDCESWYLVLEQKDKKSQ